MPSTPSTSNSDKAKKKAADYKLSKQQIAKRREQSQNSATNDDSITTIAEPPPPSTSSASILASAIANNTPTILDTIYEPPPPPTCSSMLTSAIPENSEDTSNDITLPPSISSPPSSRTRKRSPISAAAIAQKQADLHNFKSNSRAPASATKANNTPTILDTITEPPPPSTSSDSIVSLAMSSLTTDEFIERKRQTMDWPSALPESNEEDEWRDDPQEHTEPPPSLELEQPSIVHVQATPVFEDDSDVEEHSNKNPFKDWRVLVFVMILVSALVGLTVGLVMKGGNGANDNGSLPPGKDLSKTGGKTAFAFSMEISTSNVNSINTAALADVTEAHMAEVMSRNVVSFEDIYLNVTLVASKGSDGANRTRGGRRRRMAVVTAIFEAAVTLEDDSTLPTDKSTFVEYVLSTSFSPLEQEKLLESMEDAGLGVTSLSSPTALVVVEEPDAPSKSPTDVPTKKPITSSTTLPSGSPTKSLSVLPSVLRTTLPTVAPSNSPSAWPTTLHTVAPSNSPSALPTKLPSALPSTSPTVPSSNSPSAWPTTLPTVAPSNSNSPTKSDWLQIGKDIDGEAADDWSGWAVSLSSEGSVVAIGAPQNDGNGSLSGHVRVFKNVDLTWVQIGKDIDGEAEGDQSGRVVSLSSDGSVVAIGASQNDVNGSSSGHVRVFKNVDSTWVQIGEDIDGEAKYDQSGQAVSLSADGSVVAIGASQHDGNGLSSGHVRVFKNVDSTWVQIGEDIDGEAEGDWSGYAVSLSSDGSVVAIGAPFNDGNGSSSGHVRVFKNVDSTWVQIGEDIDGEAEGDQSGYAVSLSSEGSVVAIGASQNDGNGLSSGHVRVFKNVDSTWVQIGEDIDGEAEGDQSGYAVSLSSEGSVIAIGARFNNDNGLRSGHVRVFKNVDSTWVQIGEDIDGEAERDQSGYAVSLSSEGSVVAIGAPFNDDNGSGSGYVKIFTTKQLN